MQSDRHPGKLRIRGTHGFSLIEVMVVMVIVSILAVGVVFMFANPTAKVKAAAFEMRGDFNLARAEAVSRNENILIQFVGSAKESCSKETQALFADCFAGGVFQGYVICFNEDQATDDDCSDEAATAADLEEKIVKTVLFRDSLQYYEFGATLPSSPIGPTPGTAPGGVTLVSNNGITFAELPIPGNDFIYMNSNGTSSDTGSVVVYLPKDGDPTTMTVRGKPYAVVVDSVSTGRVRLERWRPDLNPPNGNWSRK